MVDQARARRLAKRISEIVASAIEYEIKDPGLTGVTIIDAKMTGDLHDATLYYTVLGATLDDEPDYEGAAAALERAKGVLRSKVGAGTGVRFTPTLTFTRDTVSDSVQRMEELLARARAADADVARVREGATPAGDPDPYRVGGEEQGDEDTPGDDAGRGAARGGSGQSDTPGDDAGRGAARGGSGQSDLGAPTANGKDAGDNDERED
ncbi:30S ribosome-binding factor RbfA [Mycobacterium sp.]|jgi:ribosome-binding factor A|uniref:30S ribosome-binding factor RbfA n=1 Tax=Mycobacterium sp. TaxID=1785 RepID=UPI0039C8FCAA